LKANPFSDTLALRAIGLISANIRKVFLNGLDLEARNNMMLAALFGGICISASSTCAVHALSYPLGGKYRIPHGVSNAILLPYVIEYNRDAVINKYVNIAEEMKINTNGLLKSEISEKVVEAIFTLIKDLGLESDLKNYGVVEKDLDELSNAAFSVKRLLDNNPKPMSVNDIKTIYRRLI
jgi:alcohol dehydrogenase